MESKPSPTTRERILDAALRVGAARGFSGLTLREVAQEAGVATGLANYHFAGKQALLLELIAISRARFLGELQRRAPSGDVSQVLRQLLELSMALPSFMPGWFRLNADIDALGLREPALQPAAALSKRRGADDVHGFLRGLVVQAAAPDDPPDPDALRPFTDVVYAAVDGLALRWLLDPTFDLQAAYLEIERLVLARIAPGAQPSPAAWKRELLAGVDPGPLGRAAGTAVGARTRVKSRPRAKPARMRTRARGKPKPRTKPWSER